MKMLVLPVFFGILLLTFLISCEDETFRTPVEFEKPCDSLTEGSSLEVTLALKKAATKEVEVKLRLLKESTTEIGEDGDYSITGGVYEDSIFTLTVPKNSSVASFKVEALEDFKTEETELIRFAVESVSNEIEFPVVDTLSIFIVNQDFGAVFTETTSAIDEGLKRKKITIAFEKPLDVNATLQLKISQNESTYNEDYKTEPIAVNGFVSLPVAKGAVEASFLVSSNLDLTTEVNEYLFFEFADLPDGFVGRNTHHLQIMNNTLMDGLVGEYLFDGNAFDTSPSSHHGFINGAVMTGDHLNSGNYAFSFDGVNDYISIPNNPSTNFNTTQNFSISLWVAVSATQPDVNGTINDIIRKWEGDAQGYPFAIGYYNNTADPSLRNKITCVRYDGQGCSNTPAVNTPVIATESYHHLVFVKNGTTLKLYLNKNLVAQTTDNTSCSTANTSAITLGSRGNLVRFLKGKIDDVRFYSRPLLTGEIEKLFQI